VDARLSQRPAIRLMTYFLGENQFLSHVRSELSFLHRRADKTASLKFLCEDHRLLLVYTIGPLLLSRVSELYKLSLPLHLIGE